MSNWRRLKEIFTSSIPLILTFLAQVIVEITDAVILSRVSPSFLAVSGLSGAFKGVLTIFAVGVLNYSIVLFAEKDKYNGYKTIISGFYFIIAFFALISFPSYLYFDFLHLLNINEQLVSQTKPFFAIRLIGLPFFLIFVLFKYYISSNYKTNIIWVISISSIIINLIGDLIAITFIELPLFQLYGVAICSTSTDFIMGASALLFCLIKDKELWNSLKKLFAHKDIKSYFKRLITFGIPIGATFVYEMGFFFLMTLFMGKIGVHELAAYQVVLQLTTFAFMFTLGTSEALMILLSRAIKDNKTQEVFQLTKVGLLVGAFYSSLFFLLFYFFTGLVTSLYFDKDNSNHLLPLNFASIYLCYAAFIQIFDTLQIMLSSVLKSHNETFIPMVFYFISYFIIGLSSSYFACFVLGYGIHGLWLGVFLGVVTLFTLLLIRVVQKFEIINIKGSFLRSNPKSDII